MLPHLPPSRRNPLSTRAGRTTAIAAVMVMASGGIAFAAMSRETAVAAPPPVEIQAADAIAPEQVTPTTEAPKPTGLSTAAIKAAQEKLKSMGYWLPNADGKTGANTTQAVMAFQKVNGQKRSGTLDQATATAIEEASRPSPANKTGNHIEVDKKRQVIHVVRNGEALWTFNTSTGTERPYVTDGYRGTAKTPEGTFAVNRLVDGVDEGPLGNLYRPRYFTNNGIAVHGAASIPASPAAHGCARVSNAVMDFIWAENLMPMTSVVWVYSNPKTQPMGKAITPTPTTIPTTTTSKAPTTTSTTVKASTTSTTVAEITTTTAAPTS